MRQGAGQPSPLNSCQDSRHRASRLPITIRGRDCGHPLVIPVHTFGQEGDDLAGVSHSLQPYQLDWGLGVYTPGLRDNISPVLIHAALTSENINKVENYHHDYLLSGRRVATRPGIRSLTDQFDAMADTMAVMVSPPDSPPDLSGSKSSKSSSTHSSSQFSNHDGALSNISNFEDIELGDEKSALVSAREVQERLEAPKRPTPKIVPILPPTSPPRTNIRPLISSQRSPKYPSLQRQVTHAAGQTPPLPLYVPRSAGPLRRGFTSPSIPAFYAPFGPRPRSISPKHRVAALNPSAAFGGAGDRLSPLSPRNSLPPPSRRGSWQPSRKTIKELEAEYNEADDDDDLPDDASLWNVPMSPRLASERRLSMRSSTHVSPEREVTQLPPPIPLSHTISAPVSPPSHKQTFSNTLPRLRPPPRTTSMNATTFSASNPSSPQSRTSLRAHRAKSWTLAIAELSEEARILNQQLEYHAEVADREREQAVQNGNLLPRPSFDANSRRSSKPSALPPVQKGSLDFMPVSKEKEALLSRTRPSWLPPKDPKEEKKHLKEYQRMMANAVEVDKKREVNQAVQRCGRDDTRDSLNKIWEEYVCPSWNVAVSETSTRELWWKGVSPKVRGQVWQRAVGNALSLNEKSYHRALARATDIKTKPSEQLTEQEKGMLAWFTDIERDAETAFPELNLFQKNGPMWLQLINVSEAYACYRNDVGFVYGVHLMAAVLLLQLERPEDVFVLLANALNRNTPAAFLTCDVVGMEIIYNSIQEKLGKACPRLSRYLFSPETEPDTGGLELSGEELFEPMLRTMFANGMDLDRLVRVWDCWVFEGDRLLIRTAIAILASLETQIFGMEGEGLTKRRNVIEMLGWGPKGRHHGYWDLTSTGDVDGFMKDVRDMGRRTSMIVKSNTA